jgi:GGDEF domain-containing protein
MGLSDARKYIADLRKRQSNPYLWPDYLTGLPDKASILRKLEEIYPKIGKYSVAYVRISNIQSYLIKYGPNRHADIIQWAAAILKTSADSRKNGFAGTLSTHDFMVICDCRDMQKLMEQASALFSKRIVDYYSKVDMKKQETLSFKKSNGKAIRIGLMKLVCVVADKKLPVKKSDLIINMARVCDALESTDDEMAIMTKDMLCTD